MLTGLSDYLKTALGDGLSKFVQPDKVIAATIFLVLNLIDAILNARDFAGPVNLLITVFFNMNPFLQAALGVVVILLLAYLLLSFNTQLFKLLTGESWRWTWYGRLLVQLQIRRRNDYIRRSKRDDLQHEFDRLTLVTSFAAEEAFTYPTMFGNVQQATQDYISRHYGIDMIALLPHMESVIANNNVDTALSSLISNEKSALDFLVNMTCLFVLFAIELTAQFFTLPSPWTLVWVGGSLLLAVVTYNGAIVKARSWGDVVQAAFDMHCDDLRQKLGLRAFTSKDDEREVWRKASRYLIWGDPAGDIFDPTASSSSDKASSAQTAGPDKSQKQAYSDSDTSSSPDDVTCATHSKVYTDIQSTITDVNALPPDAGATWQKIAKRIDYRLIVTNTTRHSINDVFLYVTDERFPVIQHVPELHDIAHHIHPPSVVSAIIAPQHTQGAQVLNQLLLHIPDIAPHSSLAICYHLVSVSLTVESNHPTLIVNDVKTDTDNDTGSIDYTIELHNTAMSPLTDVKLLVYDAGAEVSDASIWGCLEYPDWLVQVQATKVSAPDGYCWTIDAIPGNTTVTLTYTVVGAQQKGGKQ